ncbi:MAG: SOUL family heme-binding protein [Verrucomicrobiales bacterium]
MAYETPNYRIMEELGEVELREYEAYLVAQVAVDGDLEGAGNRGFKVLAGYIFGGNRGSSRISMTGAVTQESAPKETKIQMTSPVTQQRGEGDFVIQFMMPSEFTLDTLPVPDDDRIELREVPARQLAAIRYSGRWSKRSYQANLERMCDVLHEASLTPTGEPVWARYDPPFKPWFMRRNEVLTEFEPVA